MPTYLPPKVSTQFVFFVSLVSQANAKLMQVNPTIAAGDFKVSIDGAALANLATLPVVTPAGSTMVKITLSASEMAGANATLVCLDAAGAEWCDLTLNIQTAARQIDDLATPTNITAGTITTVTNLTNAPTAGDFTATMKAATLARVTLVDTVTTYTGNTPQTGDSFARIGVAGAGLTAADDAVIAAIGALQNLAAGAAMTLTAGERTAIANALLDLADSIEVGLTLRQAERLAAAANAGKVSGMATATVVIRNAVADSKDRITATCDVDGNRSAIVVDLT